MKENIKRVYTNENAEKKNNARKLLNAGSCDGQERNNEGDSSTEEQEWIWKYGKKTPIQRKINMSGDGQEIRREEK